MTDWQDMIDATFGQLYDGGENKLTELAEAIRLHIRPGMKLNPCALQSRPTALQFEVCRQFVGKDPGFEFISSSISNTSLALVHLGLVKKAVVSFAGESYPTPGPSPVVQRALNEQGFALEHWTMLTISQRLMAGAMGVPYLPTRSLAGSTIGEELKAQGLYVEMDDPDNPGQTFGMVRAYRPDISLVHAWAADHAGNALCYPPYGENIYGALAAREGVIVSADHIVPTSFIRQHANLVRVPAAVVKAVCHVPYGCHPSGNFAQSVDGLKPYGNDYAFISECRTAAKKPDAFTDWIDEWVLGCVDQAEYLDKLGSPRLEYLHSMAEPETWKSELQPFAETLSENRPATAIETMIVQGARLMVDRIRSGELKTVLSGIGQATLMAWLAAHQLRGEGLDVTMMAETGIYGHDPRPSDPFVFNFFNLHTTTMLTDIFETLGLHTSGADNACIGTFGAGQIDRFGNVNSTRMQDGTFIVGSGGANDIATGARESIVLAQQRAHTFVEEVDYITSPGARIQAVVSTLGRFEKHGGDEFILTGWFGADGLGQDAAVRAIQDSCSWALRIAEDLEELPPATPDELALIRVYDPEGFFREKPARSTQAPAS